MGGLKPVKLYIVLKKTKMSKLLSWNSYKMSLVLDLRSRLSHLKDIIFGLEAMEAENSLGQHKHNLHFETMLGLYFLTIRKFSGSSDPASPS